jgi:hypothetical protein
MVSLHDMPSVELHDNSWAGLSSFRLQQPGVGALQHFFVIHPSFYVFLTPRVGSITQLQQTSCASETLKGHLRWLACSEGPVK